MNPNSKALFLPHKLDVGLGPSYFSTAILVERFRFGILEEQTKWSVTLLGQAIGDCLVRKQRPISSSSLGSGILWVECLPESLQSGVHKF